MNWLLLLAEKRASPPRMPPPLMVREPSVFPGVVYRSAELPHRVYEI